MKQDEVRVGEEGADEEGDDVPHPVVGVEEQLAAGLREVAQAVAGVEHLRVTKKRPVKIFREKSGKQLAAIRVEPLIRFIHG